MHTLWNRNSWWSPGRDDSFLYIKYKGANDNESSCCQIQWWCFARGLLTKKMTNHNSLTSSVDRKKNGSQDSRRITTVTWKLTRFWLWELHLKYLLFDCQAYFKTQNFCGLLMKEWQITIPWQVEWTIRKVSGQQWLVYLIFLLGTGIISTVRLLSEPEDCP